MIAHAIALIRALLIVYATAIAYAIITASAVMISDATVMTLVDTIRKNSWMILVFGTMIRGFATMTHGGKRENSSASKIP